jgi:site-specific DNA-methyltransferase (adenine-specific)
MLELYNEDCLVALKNISSESVDAIITDPPYGIDYQSARRIDPKKRHEKIENDKKPFIWFLYDAFRVLKFGGGLLVFCRWDVQEIFRIAIECAGFVVKNQLVWDRGVHGMGDLKGSFAPQHDVIWFAVKGDWEVPGARPKSVIRVDRVPAEKMIHPNEKPLGLMMSLIEGITKSEAIILDPFMGSGVCGEACRRLGRSFVGIEVDKRYFDGAKQRIESTIEIKAFSGLL